jgi:phage-related protein
MDWIVEFYRDSKGKEPAAEFLDSLSLSTRAKMVRLIDLLSKKGVLLKEPYTKQVKGKIRELRVKDKEGAVRILYFSFTGKKFILLHGMIKKTNKTPKGDIETAEKRMNDFLQKYGGRYERKDFK